MFFTADSGLLVYSQYVLYHCLRTSCPFSVCSLLLTQDFLSILSMFFTTASGLLVHSQYVLYCWLRTSCPFSVNCLLWTQDAAFLKVYRDLAGISWQARMVGTWRWDETSLPPLPPPPRRMEGNHFLPFPTSRAISRNFTRILPQRVVCINLILC